MSVIIISSRCTNVQDQCSLMCTCSISTLRPTGVASDMHLAPGNTHCRPFAGSQTHLHSIPISRAKLSPTLPKVCAGEHSRTRSYWSLVYPIAIWEKQEARLQITHAHDSAGSGHGRSFCKRGKDGVNMAGSVKS